MPKLLGFIVLAILYYLIACFINNTFNPLEWGTFTKIVYCSGAILSAYARAQSEE